MYFTPKDKQDLWEKIEYAVNKPDQTSLVNLNKLLDWFIEKFEDFYYKESNMLCHNPKMGTITIYEREFIFDHLVYFLAQKLKEPWGNNLSEVNYQFLTEKDFGQIGTQICSVLWHLYGIPSKTAGLFKKHLYFEDLLSLVKEFGHRVIGIDRKLDFMSLYRNFFQVEPAIYFTERYRDHIYHTIYIAILGEVLLRTELNTGKTFLTIMKEAKVKRIEDIKKKGIKDDKIKLDLDLDLDVSNLESDLSKAWFLSSLLHDIGYTVKLINLFKDTPLQSELKNIVQDKIIKTYPGQKDFDSHGIYSAMFLENLKNVKPWKEQTFFKLAKDAIIKHDDYTVVDFSENPIAFLLIILDEIQEYERPHIHRERFRTKVYYDIHSEGHQIDIREDVPKSILEISKLSASKGNGCYTLLSNNLNFVVKLGETKFVTKEFHLYLEQHPTFIVTNWISKKRNLSRLKIEKDILNIKVTFEVPKDEDTMDKFLGEQINYLKNIGYQELEKYFGSAVIKEELPLSDDLLDIRIPPDLNNVCEINQNTKSIIFKGIISAKQKKKLLSLNTSSTKWKNCIENLWGKIEITIDSEAKIFIPYYFDDNESNFIKEEVSK